jgi:hypothetical protein
MNKFERKAKDSETGSELPYLHKHFKRQNAKLRHYDKRIEKFRRELEKFRT